MTSLRMQAPTACIFGLPAATSRSKNPLSRGLKRMAVSVGRYSALRSRALPAFDSRVRLRTEVPLRNSRGAKPQAAAADSAEGSRSTAGSSARTVVAVWRPTPGMVSSHSRAARSAGLAALRAADRARQWTDVRRGRLPGGRAAVAGERGDGAGVGRVGLVALTGGGGVGLD